MRRSAEAPLAFLLLCACWLCGCFTPFEVECFEDAHCNRFPGGLCHTNPQTERRWCSYPDAACSTGYRYSDLDVGDGVSAVCTGEPPARCDPSADFGEPTLVASLSSLLIESAVSVTRDELLLLLSRDGPTDNTLLTSTRASTADEFPLPSADTGLDLLVAVPGFEYQAWLSWDGLFVYFVRQLASDHRFFVATRSNVSGSFNAGTELTLGSAPLPSSSLISNFQLSIDGRTLYWEGPDGMLRSARSVGLPHSFGPEIRASFVTMFSPRVSADELAVYYSDGNDVSKVYRAARASKDAPFEAGASIPSLEGNPGSFNIITAVSVDDCLLYMRRSEPLTVNADIWVARRPR
jgi:hypothetical protein